MVTSVIDSPMQDALKEATFVYEGARTFSRSGMFVPLLRR